MATTKIKKNIQFFITITICLLISSKIDAQSKKLKTDKKQFEGIYKIKMDVGDGTTTIFTAAVKLANGKLTFIVSEGGSMHMYYDEISYKEIKKNMEYHFKARNLDMESPTTFRFKKKETHFELTYDY